MCDLLYQNSFDDEIFTIYPNPAFDLLCIKHKENQQVTNLKIFNIEGKAILNMDRLFESEINISELKKGLYLIKLSINENSYNYKFLKD